MNYIKLTRDILDHPVFAHQVAFKIWMWCLLRASYKNRSVPFKVSKGDTIVNIKAGQFIFGRFKAEESLGIDGSTIYRWMQTFASEGWDLITIESNNQYSIITICNWDKYQQGDNKKEQPKNSKRTANEQPMDNGRTTDEHKQEGLEGKECIIEYSEFYKSELIKSNHDENYKNFIDFLYGLNGNDGICDNVLKLKSQLSFSQFQDVLKIYDSLPIKKPLSTIVANMDNHKGLAKDYSSFSRTLKNWVRNESNWGKK
jgi:hypothetical protein